MKKQLLRTKIVGVATLALIVVLSWLLLLGPAASKPAGIAEETSAAQAAESATLAQIGAAREKVANLAQLQADIELLNSRFPSVVDPALVEGKVRQVATDAGLPPEAVISITLGEVAPYQDPAAAAAAAEGGDAAAATPSAAPPGEEGSTVLQQPVAIQVAGSLEQIGAFTDRLGGGYGFAVRGLNVTANSTAGPYQGAVDSVVFLLPPLPEPPTQEQVAAIGDAVGEGGGG